MGCVSSTLIGNEEDFPHLGGSTAFGHHIVSLTSTTYGLLSVDHQHSSPPPLTPSSPSPPSSSNVPATTPATTTTTTTITTKPEIINSWELMAGLDSTPDPSFRFTIPPPPTTDHKDDNHEIISKNSNSLDRFEKICPPNGQEKVVIYTTTLRGVRETYEACNAVRSALESYGVSICERDISLDRGFREELRELLKKKVDDDDDDDEDNRERKSSSVLIPPRVFIKGRYIGGAEEVMWVLDQEEGGLQDLLQGLPRLNKAAAGRVCDGCGGARFLPCFNCNGSCKIVMLVKQNVETAPLNLQQRRRRVVVLKCSQCNENGLVLCPICS